MALIDTESSKYDGRPIEFYEFTADGQSYYRTPNRKPYDFGGHTFLPAPKLGRDNVVRTAMGDKAQELIVTIDESDAVIRDNCYDSVPVSFRVRIYRSQPGGSATWWDGEIAGASIKGDVAQLRCPSILDTLFQNEVPGVHFTEQCSHFLFDSHCRLDPLDYAESSAVSSIVNGTTINVSTINGHADGFFKGGVILSVSGEKRLIVEQIGTELTIFHPFRDISALEALTLYPGCDRSMRTCVDVFDNGDNFGGYPVIGFIDIFRRALRGLTN